MSARFPAIDLANLPAPDVVEVVSFETILDELKDDFLSRNPEEDRPALTVALALESEPLAKLLEVAAYRETVWRARVNDAARSTMIAYATGADLEHEIADLGVARMVREVEDGECEYESDARLRRRAQLALDGFAVAGPREAYIFWGLAADLAVKDVDPQNPAPGEILITVLGVDGDGAPSPLTIKAVEDRLSPDDIRPLGDEVTVQSATIVPYAILATLTVSAGLDAATVESAAFEAAETYVSERQRLGADIARSGIFAALHREGVVSVDLDQPAADLAIAANEAGYCTGIALAIGDADV